MRSSSILNTYKDYKKISIITAVFNGEKHIEGCIQSVLAQNYQNLEYIIIDGSSRDSTLSIIEKYKAKIDFVYSAPDNGISQAMNRGISFSTGEYIIFLNSDDFFESTDSVSSIVTSSTFSSDIIIADILFGSDNTRKSPRGFDFWMNLKTGIFHQGAICKKCLFEKYGNFNENLKITLDYEFFLRMYRQGVTVEYIPKILSVMRDTGVSSKTDWDSLKKRFREEKLSFKVNTSSRLALTLYSIYWSLYIAYRRIRYFVC